MSVVYAEFLKKRFMLSVVHAEFLKKRFMLSGVMLSVIMLSAVMLSGVILSVVAPWGEGPSAPPQSTATARVRLQLYFQRLDQGETIFLRLQLSSLLRPVTECQAGKLYRTAPSSGW